MYSCVNWSASCTTKGIKHISLRENQIRERHQAGDVCVAHIPGIINPSDIFTKEIKDTAHFRRLRDSMMVSKTAFLKYHHTVPSEVIASERILPYYSLRSPQAPQPIQSRQIAKAARGSTCVIVSESAGTYKYVPSEDSRGRGVLGTSVPFRVPFSHC